MRPAVGPPAADPSAGFRAGPTPVPHPPCTPATWHGPGRDWRFAEGPVAREPRRAAPQPPTPPPASASRLASRIDDRYDRARPDFVPATEALAGTSGFAEATPDTSSGGWPAQAGEEDDQPLRGLRRGVQEQRALPPNARAEAGLGLCGRTGGPTRRHREPSRAGSPEAREGTHNTVNVPSCQPSRPQESVSLSDYSCFRRISASPPTASRISVAGSGTTAITPSL